MQAAETQSQSKDVDQNCLMNVLIHPVVRFSLLHVINLIVKTQGARPEGGLLLHA
jgi:hypothetical protein